MQGVARDTSISNISFIFNNKKSMSEQTIALFGGANIMVSIVACNVFLVYVHKRLSER